jgi:hypothetical protein
LGLGRGGIKTEDDNDDEEIKKQKEKNELNDADAPLTEYVLFLCEDMS